MNAVEQWNSLSFAKITRNKEKAKSKRIIKEAASGAEFRLDVD